MTDMFDGHELVGELLASLVDDAKAATWIIYISGLFSIECFERTP